MQEKDIEHALIQAVKNEGGLCPKFTSPGTNGYPDRLVLLPGRHWAFVELKSPGKKPRPLQRLRHEELRRLGYRVFVLDDPDMVSIIVRRIKEGRNAFE